jgi:branched-chain amino acid transport system substrate-binding protein
MKMCRLAPLGLLLIVAALLLAPAAADARNIKVGILDSYSGPPAVFGNDALNGFKLALEEINKQGVLGGKIEFVTRDDKFKVDIGLNMAKELVLKENVDVIVGVVNSGVALAVSDAVAKKEKVPFFTWMGKSENITGKAGHRYMFSVTENTAMSGKAAANVLSKKGYKRIWVAGDDYEYGHALDDSFARYMKQLKPDVEFVGRTWWKLGEPDLVPYFTSIQAANPDLIHFCTGGASMANVLKTIKATGINQKTPIYIHTAIDYAVLKPLGTDAPEGVMGTMDYLFYYPELSTNQKFVKEFQARYNMPPGFPAFHAYITAHFIAEGFRQAGNIDKEKFIDAVEGLKVDSPVGKVEMRACDHQTILPILFGTTKISKEYGAAIATDIVTLRGAEVMPSCEEVQATRK